MSAAQPLPLSIEAFEAAQISPDDFNHEGHVYIAWLYVQSYPLSEAISRFDGALRRLVRKLGAEQKYHATITWFFMFLIAERSNESHNWQRFCAENTDIVRDAKQLLAGYYSDALLFSPIARRQFVMPDKLAA